MPSVFPFHAPVMQPKHSWGQQVLPERTILKTTETKEHNYCDISDLLVMEERTRFIELSNVKRDRNALNPIQS